MLAYCHQCKSLYMLCIKSADITTVQRHLPIFKKSEPILSERVSRLEKGLDVAGKKKCRDVWPVQGILSSRLRFAYFIILSLLVCAKT
jgi:hypothetical protein